MDDSAQASSTREHLHPQVNNLEAITIRALAPNSPVAWQQATRAASELCIFGYFSGHPFPALGKIFSVIVSQLDDSPEKSSCMDDSLGRMAIHRNEYADARQQFEQAMVLYDEVADRRGKAHCIYALGEIALYQDEYA